MIINVMEQYKKALKLEIDTKVGRDDPNVTYQEYCLYIMLYSIVNQHVETIDPDKNYILIKDGWVDEHWDTMKASKYHKKIIDKSWDQVFVIK